MTRSHRISLLAVVTLLAILTVWLLPPIPQDQAYHEFADQQTVFGIPHFWNVISNAAFLLVAIYGLRALRNPLAFQESWERRAYIVLLAATALTALGSGYYHYDPNDATLFWDRLPMTLVFMSLLASVAGERLGIRIGRLFYFILLAAGAAALLYWRVTGDLRLYGFVQFYPALVLPLLVILFPGRYTGLSGLIWTAIFYLIAKLLEGYDRQIAQVIAMGGHPSKHLAAAAALWSYVRMVGERKPL
jgi:Ca2+/Na+ antiporter